MRTRGTVGASRSNRWVLRQRGQDGKWTGRVRDAGRAVFGRDEVVGLRDKLEKQIGDELLIVAAEVFETPSDLGPDGFGFLDPRYVL